MNNRKYSKSGDVFAWIIVGMVLLLIFGSIIGVWIKLFWIGWVFGGC